MGNVYHDFGPLDGVPSATGYATIDVVAAAAYSVSCLDFDASAEEGVFFYFLATGYGSGNLTLRIDWYADTASSGDVIWEAQLAAITPNVDSQDVETKAFATAQVVTDTHLGTTGQRLHTIDLPIVNLDSLAADDWCVLRVYRDATAGGDTMTGDASVTRLRLAYSDV